MIQPTNTNQPSSQMMIMRNLGNMRVNTNNVNEFAINNNLQRIRESLNFQE